MKRILQIIWTLTMLAVPAMAQDAGALLNKAAAQIKNSRGISASYTFISKQTGKQTGSIKISGNKFCIINPVISTWYNGKYQWNVNHGSGEVTLSIPDKEELQMVNPCSIVSSYASSYTPTLLKSKIKNTHCIRLTPKKKGSAIRKIILYLSASNSQPVRADITTDTGQINTIVVSNYRTGQNFGASEFVFPQKKYPKVKVIDLR